MVFWPVSRILVWSGVALTAAPRAISHHHAIAAGITVAPADEHLATSCNDLHVRFDRHDAVAQSEQRSISKSDAQSYSGRACWPDARETKRSD